MYPQRTVGKKFVFPQNRTEIVFQFFRGKSFLYDKDSFVRTEKMKFNNVYAGKPPSGEEVIENLKNIFTNMNNLFNRKYTQKKTRRKWCEKDKNQLQ